MSEWSCRYQTYMEPTSHGGPPQPWAPLTNGPHAHQPWAPLTNGPHAHQPWAQLTNGPHAHQPWALWDPIVWQEQSKILHAQQQAQMGSTLMGGGDAASPTSPPNRRTGGGRDLAVDASSPSGGQSGGKGGKGSSGKQAGSSFKKGQAELNNERPLSPAATFAVARVESVRAVSSPKASAKRSSKLLTRREIDHRLAAARERALVRDAPTTTTATTPHPAPRTHHPSPAPSLSLSPLTPHHSPLTPRPSPLTSHPSPSPLTLAPHPSPLTTHHSPLTTHHSPLTLTTHSHPGNQSGECQG